MAKRYAKINWQDYPSVATPRNAANLNKMDKGIDDLDNAIEALNDNLAGLIKYKDISVSVSGLASNANGYTTYTIPAGYIPLSVKCTSHLWYLVSLSYDTYLFYKNIDGVSKTETVTFRVYFIKSSLIMAG